MQKRSGIIIGIMICLVILAGAGFGLYRVLEKRAQEDRHLAVIENQRTQSRQLVADYFALVAKGRYEELYGMLSPDSRAAIDKVTLITRYQNIYGGIGAEGLVTEVGEITDYGVRIGGGSDQEDSREPAVVRRQVQYTQRMDTVAGEITFTNYVIVSLTGEDQLSIEWTPHLFFPTMSWNDKIRVNQLPGERGNIYDRNGTLLAGAGVASAVGFVPGKMSRDGQSGGYIEADIARAAELLEMTPESVWKKVQASYVKEDTFVPLKTVSKEAYELKEQLLTIPGILITDTPVRVYPLAEKASHLIGYIQGINAEELEKLRDQGYTPNSMLGKSGLESMYEEHLRGIDGCEIIITDENGAAKETVAVIGRRVGQDLNLTIDAQMQTRLYDMFAQDKSCSVAMNPRTGEVLALVSTPTFDANDFILGMSPATWSRLSEDENKPMFNRFKAALCPGSTFKGVTAAIGINTGVVSPSEDFGHSGLKWRKDDSWGGYYIKTTREYKEAANVENALVYSDNIYFAKTALKLGADLFAEQLVKLGFEERIPFEYALYSSTISSTETFTSEVQLADSGYGQGQILVNPIHLASLYSSFVNEGNLIQPYLIARETAAPEFWKTDAFTAETARIVRDSLIQVIERGTGTDAKIPGMLLGGKTGTAEIKQSKDDRTGTELGWFVLFTADEQAERPLLVLSMVEDVKGRGGSHYVSGKLNAVFQ